MIIKQKKIPICDDFRVVLPRHTVLYITIVAADWLALYDLTHDTSEAPWAPAGCNLVLVVGAPRACPTVQTLYILRAVN